MFAESPGQKTDEGPQHVINHREALAPQLQAPDFKQIDAALIVAGELRSTRTGTPSPIHAANLHEAHRRLESGSAIGKQMLAGW